MRIRQRLAGVSNSSIGETKVRGKGVAGLISLS